MYLSEKDLAADLTALGITAGDTVIVHAAMRAVGDLIDGPDTLISALLAVLGPYGTLMAYTDWDARYEALLDDEGTIPEDWRDKVGGYDPLRSRAARDNGIFAEFLRTTPGAKRSANPGASMTAIGGKAGWLLSGHSLDYGYGEMSPLAKLVDLKGKVLMVGAPLDTMTLLHHAEHAARIPGKRIKRWDVPFATAQGVVWRRSEEFDTSDAVSPDLDGVDYFTAIVKSHLASGRGRTGMIGRAESVLVEAEPMFMHAVRWLELQVR